jgi:hypothetical protein
MKRLYLMGFYLTLKTMKIQQSAIVPIVMYQTTYSVLLLRLLVPNRLLSPLFSYGLGFCLLAALDNFSLIISSLQKLLTQQVRDPKNVFVLISLNSD